VEREQLKQMMKTHHPLLEKCSLHPPDAIELSALAAMLHSFYTGAENIFKRIALEMDGALPKGENWHRELLEQVAKPTQFRPGVISPEMCEVLKVYLSFRHFFRHAYLFQFRWEKMSDLVLKCEQTLERLEAELDAFFIHAGEEKKS